MEAVVPSKYLYTSNRQYVLHSQSQLCEPQIPDQFFPSVHRTKNYASHTKKEFNPISKQEKLAYRIGRQFFCSNNRGKVKKAELYAYILNLYYTD